LIRLSRKIEFETKDIDGIAAKQFTTGPTLDRTQDAISGPEGSSLTALPAITDRVMRLGGFKGSSE